ncbi:MAG: YIP1 family protein [Gammaproteobacteria bacterium TMED163]|nr:MAG: YIP1 family protein [Gammaproteobacteria bacterium TMED163]
MGKRVIGSGIFSFLLLKAFYKSFKAFTELAKVDPSPISIIFRYLLWLMLLPPLSSLIGAANFGWRLGANEPLMMGPNTLILISVGYFFVLLFGLVTTAIIGCWMAGTCGASESLGRHFALITIVAQPLAIASIAHLFPDVLVNVLILIPTLIWSMYLLYKDIPIALDTPPERGMPRHIWQMAGSSVSEPA